MQTVNDQLRDKAIAHDILLQRYYSNVSKDALKILADTEKDLIRQLKVLEFENGMTIKQIDDRLKSVQSILNEGYAKIGMDLKAEYQDLAIYEQEWQQKSIKDALPIAFDTVAVAPVTLFAAIELKPFEGLLLKEWIDKLDADSFNSIQREVRQGLVQGLSYSDITKRIIGTKALQYSDGVLHLNRNKTQALVSTAVAHVTNTARDEFYKSNDDLIKAVQWLSTLDGRTTMLCKSRDGKVYPVDSGVRPPAHFRCRSVVTPVMKSWKELGLKEPDGLTRSSMNGQVSDSETYQTWLQKQPHSFQDETLGKARAEMFRSGTPLDRFVDESGHTYTLEQLRNIEK